LSGSQHLSALSGSTFCKPPALPEVADFVLPHASLRQALTEPIPTPGSGSAKVWRPCTPAMAAGWTAHVWSLKEVLLFRVPPWPQPQTV